MNTTEIFLVAMLVIFTVPRLAWRLVHTDSLAPLPTAQILTGCAPGPGLKGAWFLQGCAFAFTRVVMQRLAQPTSHAS